MRSISYHDFFIKSAELLVFDDVKIQFFHKNKKTFHLWFNTWFIDSSGQLFLNKNMIDKASGDKRCLKYDVNFSMKIFMTRVEEFKLYSQNLKLDSKPKKNHKEEEVRMDDSDVASEILAIDVNDKTDAKHKKAGYEPALVPKRVLTEQQKKLLSIAEKMPQKNCKIGL